MRSKKSENFRLLEHVKKVCSKNWWVVRECYYAPPCVVWARNRISVWSYFFTKIDKTHLFSPKKFAVQMRSNIWGPNSTRTTPENRCAALDFDSRLKKVFPVHIRTYLGELMQPNGLSQNANFHSYPSLQSDLPWNTTKLQNHLFGHKSDYIKGFSKFFFRTSSSYRATS